MATLEALHGAGAVVQQPVKVEELDVATLTTVQPLDERIETNPGDRRELHVAVEARQGLRPLKSSRLSGRVPGGQTDREEPAVLGIQVRVTHRPHGIHTQIAQIPIRRVDERPKPVIPLLGLALGGQSPIVLEIILLLCDALT